MAAARAQGRGDSRRAGFPVYQTWFVSRARPITGTLTDVGTLPGCAVEDAEVALLSPSGEELATAAVTPRARSTSASTRPRPGTWCG